LPRTFVDSPIVCRSGTNAPTEVCKKRLNRRLAILHGYDYPVPDGRAFMGGWGFLPGPWLEPGFREKGFEQMPERIRLMK